MKRKTFNQLSIIIILLTLSININAQVVTANPALPTASDQVVITFDATKATRTDLLNYTGDVYVHTGVTIGTTKWQHVIESWGNNTTQPKLTRTGTNTYTFTISPSIRQFYNVPDNEQITQLCFVFRSSSSPYKQTEDIFYTVYEQGLSVSITSPSKDNPVYEINSNIAIQAGSNGSTSLKLYIDNNEVSTTDQTSISYNYTANSYGEHWIKAIASNSTQTQKDSTYITVRSPVITENLPTGLKLGVNKIDNSTVTLVLNDPIAKKNYCYAIGDFSNWMVKDQFYMKRSTDGKYYLLTISNLDPTKEYIYQYFIDGQIRIADPYCSKTSDPNDHYISQTNYPSLISYPNNKTTGVASVFKINDDSYAWKTTTFTPPLKKDLIIYELLVRDFTSGDYIKTAMDSISYLKKLGVNAIELMPISEFQGNDSWGYNPSFYFAPDKAYGTKNDYKAFIDECHSQGIAVIMDIVLNHSYEESPMVQMYYDKSTYKPTADNPWYNQVSPNSTYSWGYDFNHESIYTQQFVDSVLNYWVTEYKFDGFRFDFTKGFTNTTGEGTAYDASRIAILKRMADKLWSVKSNAYVILEHFCANTEETELSNYGMMLWGNLNYNYNEATMGWLSNSNFSTISYKNRGWTNPYLVGYMESHDEERLMYRNINNGNDYYPTYNIKNIDVGLNRNKLAAVFFFTVPGPKMIWQFGELGYDISIDYNGRTGRKPIHWEYFEDGNRRQLFNTYAQLTRLKRDYDVFKTDNFSTALSGATKSIILNGTDMKAVVMGNFDITSQLFTIDFPNTGRWYEYFNQDSLELSSTNFSYTFQPGEYRLYTSKRIKRDNVFVGIDNHQTNEFSDMQVWPNPNNGNFNVSFNNSTGGFYKLEIFSSIGQKIFENSFGNLVYGANTHSINLNSSLSSGIYFVKLSNKSSIFIKKIIIQ